MDRHIEATRKLPASWPEREQIALMTEALYEDLRAALIKGGIDVGPCPRVDPQKISGWAPKSAELRETFIGDTIHEYLAREEKRLGVDFAAMVSVAEKSAAVTVYLRLKGSAR